MQGDRQPAAAMLPVDVSLRFASAGWTSEASRVFFGGDDGVAFWDLSITVEGEVTRGVPEVGSSAWLLALGAAALVIWNRRRNAAQWKSDVGRAAAA